MLTFIATVVTTLIVGFIIAPLLILGIFRLFAYCISPRRK